MTATVPTYESLPDTSPMGAPLDWAWLRGQTLQEFLDGAARVERAPAAG